MEKPSLPPRKLEALLQGAFQYDGVDYLVALTGEGLHWSRTGGNRKHFLSYHEMICVGRKKTAKGGFQIVAVVPKGVNGGFFKLGPTRDRLIVFEPRKRGPQDDVEIDQWMVKIREKIDEARKIPPNKKLLVFVNPFSGSGKAGEIWKSLLPIFEVSEVPFEVVFTTKQGHAQEQAQNLDLNQYYGIVTVSGDGLLSEVLNGVMSRADWSEAVQTLRFGIIPGGSGNGLAASLGTEDPFRAAVAILTNQTHPLDIYKVEQRGKISYGFLGLEWGNLAVIDLDSDDMRWMGPARFDLKGIAVAVEGPTHRGRLSFVPEPWDKTNPPKQERQQLAYKEIPGFEDLHTNPKSLHIDDNFSIFFAANTTKIMISEGDFAPHARLSDGHLDLLIARNLGSVDLGLLLTDVENGKFTQNPHVQYYKTTAFELVPCPSSSSPIGLDGERIENCPTKVQVLKSLINIFHDTKNLPLN